MVFEPDERYQRISLRIARDMHARLQAAASKRMHSMNAEIIQRLARSLEDDEMPHLVMADPAEKRGIKVTPPAGFTPDETTSALENIIALLTAIQNGYKDNGLLEKWLGLPPAKKPSDPDEK